MTTSMKAAFTLTLNDQLTSGLAAIKKGFEDLRNKGNELTLGKLERGTDLLRTLGREVKNLTSDLRSVEAVADRGWAAMKRMASTRFSGLEKQLFGAKGFRGPGHEIEQNGRLGAIGGVISGYSVIKPVQDYATYENTLRHIAITEKLSGPAVETEVARLNTNLKADALATGQNSAELANAYKFLITTGMKAELVDKLMPTHAMAATAYNISSDSMGQAVFALNDSFKIGHQDMGAALSAMAYAAKEAHFTVENFSQFLPEIGGRMALLGMTGRPAADTAFAALETVVKNSSMPSQAAADFKDLMVYMTSYRAAHEFKQRAGIDLPGSLKAAERRGINPFDAFMGILQSLVKGKSPVASAEILGAILTNQESATAALSLLAHVDEFQRMRKELGTKDDGTLRTDFDTASRAPEVKLRSGTEAAEQLERRAGEGFNPVVQRLVDGLKAVVGGVESVDRTMPGFADATLSVTAGLLSLAAALSAIGFIAPAVKAGAGLVGGAASGLGLLNPFTLVTALPAYLMYKAWGERHEGENVDPATQVPYFDPNGIPAITSFDSSDPAAASPSSTDIASSKPDAQRLDIHLHADPGTSADVTSASPGLSFTIPNAGTTTNRP